MEKFSKAKGKVKRLCEDRAMYMIYGSSCNEMEDVWDKWNCYDASNKQKDLLWMIMHGVLPVRRVQKRRGLVVSEICPKERCGDEEHIGHVFWSCGFARSVWKKLGGSCVVDGCEKFVL